MPVPVSIRPPVLAGTIALLASMMPLGVVRSEAVDGGAGAEVAPTTTQVVADGRYRLVDPDAVDAAVRAAIEPVLTGLHPAMRDPFRAQLGSTLRAPRRIELSHRDEDLVLDFDGHALAAPLGGAERRQEGPEGRPVRVVHRLDGAVLVQELRSGQFTLVQRFVVEGARVRLEAELRTGMLPRPITTVAHYVAATEP